MSNESDKDGLGKTALPSNVRKEKLIESSHKSEKDENRSMDLIQGHLDGATLQAGRPGIFLESTWDGWETVWCAI